MKHIIELGEDANMVQVISVTQSGNAYIDSSVYIGCLERLNSDYINEHYGSLQDEAYQRGLDAAWEAATRIVCDETLGMSTLLHIFNRGTLERIFKDIPPAEAIEKLKAYEEQNTADDIKVGDEVRDDDGDTYIITCINDDGTFDALYPDGTASSRADMSIIYELTGRHFEIDKILEAMKE